MRYSKPELLHTEAALNAIRGTLKEFTDIEDAVPEFPGSLPAYEVDE